MPKLRVQRGLFDLDSFEDVTLAKDFDFEPVADVQSAAARLGNDTGKLIDIINEGLRAEARRVQAADPSGWHTMTDDGELNGPFQGTPADQKTVNALVLTLSKTSIAPSMRLDWDSATKEQRKAIKEATQKFIASTPMIRDGLKASAALKVEESETATT